MPARAAGSLPLMPWGWNGSTFATFTIPLDSALRVYVLMQAFLGWRPLAVARHHLSLGNAEYASRREPPSGYL